MRLKYNQMRNENIHIVDIIESDSLCEYVKYIEPELRKEFSKAQFSMPGITVNNVVDECLFQPAKQIYDNIVHAIVFNCDYKSPYILGALFDIPTVNSSNRLATDIGWFYTSSCMSAKSRLNIANALWDNAYKIIRHAGFTLIETTIGTTSGVKYLERSQGFRKTDRIDNNGSLIWIKNI